MQGTKIDLLEPSSCMDPDVNKGTEFKLPKSWAKTLYIFRGEACLRMVVDGRLVENLRDRVVERWKKKGFFGWLFMGHASSRPMYALRCYFVVSAQYPNVRTT